MYTQLKEKLWAYIVSNNPDLMFNLQDEYNVVRYLEEKVSGVMPLALDMLESGKSGHAIHELCLNEMTRELRPSRYHFVRGLLESEFGEEYSKLRESGMLTYETVNMVEHCKATFDEIGFSEDNLQAPTIRAVIVSRMGSYLKDKKDGEPWQ